MADKATPVSNVKERGYRIRADGPTYETMPFIDRKRLNTDMIKVVWEEDLMNETGPDAIAERINAAGGSRVVSCRRDDEEATDFGRPAGVGMLQGRHTEGFIAGEIRRREMDKVRRRPGAESTVL